LDFRLLNGKCYVRKGLGHTLAILSPPAIVTGTTLKESERSFSFLGILESWFMKFVLSPDFLDDIKDEEKQKWFNEKGEHVKDTVQKDFVELIGKPIADMIE
jgi:hypothetical protein